MKDKNISVDRRGEQGIGSIWTWTAICADTKLVPAWHVGTRDAAYAYEFMTDLAPRLRGRVQLTTDGHRAYLEAVDYAFGGAIDYAMLIKLYGAEPAGEARYSPAKCIGTRRDPISGNPDPDHVSTSYFERQNLSMRMRNRRFTRLTNAFSKKVENLSAAVALHFMYYNFARPHGSLGSKTTPAMAAGVADHVWTLDEIVGLLNPN